MTEPKELQEQIKACRRGDPEAFAGLVASFGPQLQRYFLRSVGSAGQADDLLQELFVRLLEKIKYYRDDGHFEHWLFRIAANLVRDQHRKVKRRRTRAFSEISDDEDADAALHLADSGEEPGHHLEQAEQVDRLQEALMQLPELDRQIILARHYGGLGFRELAEQFQVPLGTALAKVHRGLKQLRRLMSEDDNAILKFRQDE